VRSPAWITKAACRVFGRREIQHRPLATAGVTAASLLRTLGRTCRPAARACVHCSRDRREPSIRKQQAIEYTRTYHSPQNLALTWMGSAGIRREITSTAKAFFSASTTSASGCCSHTRTEAPAPAPAPNQWVRCRVVVIISGCVWARCSAQRGVPPADARRLGCAARRRASSARASGAHARQLALARRALAQRESVTTTHACRQAPAVQVGAIGHARG